MTDKRNRNFLEEESARETEALRENLPQSHCIHQKFHMN
jgi:hypothetical protein